MAGDNNGLISFRGQADPKILIIGGTTSHEARLVK